MLFACLAIFGMAMSSLAGFFIINWKCTTATMRIATVVQSIFQMIVPALATALLVCRRPASFLAIDRRPDTLTLILAILGLVAATPVMNCIIEWNASVSFPESLSSLEQTLRSMEDHAAETVLMLEGAHTLPNLFINILIIGVMAGFGEELFFRGTFMRLFTTAGFNRHLAIWLVAFIFSSLHLQFFGFIPRMLLGAYFGYLLAWSRCLWIPIVVHATNNILYVVTQYIGFDDKSTGWSIDSIGVDSGILLPAVSSILTAAVLFLLYRLRSKGPTV